MLSCRAVIVKRILDVVCIMPNKFLVKSFAWLLVACVALASIFVPEADAAERVALRGAPKKSAGILPKSKKPVVPSRKKQGRYQRALYFLTPGVSEGDKIFFNNKEWVSKKLPGVTIRDMAFTQADDVEDYFRNKVREEVREKGSLEMIFFDAHGDSESLYPSGYEIDGAVPVRRLLGVLEELNDEFGFPVAKDFIVMGCDVGTNLKFDQVAWYREAAGRLWINIHLGRCVISSFQTDRNGWVGSFAVFRPDGSVTRSWMDADPMGIMDVYRGDALSRKLVEGLAYEFKREKYEYSEAHGNVDSLGDCYIDKSWDEARQCALGGEDTLIDGAREESKKVIHVKAIERCIPSSVFDCTRKVFIDTEYFIERLRVVDQKMLKEADYYLQLRESREELSGTTPQARGKKNFHTSRRAQPSVNLQRVP
jgi:hypothetical protein